MIDSDGHCGGGRTLSCCWGKGVSVVVAVLLIAGDHVPVIPLLEVVGKRLLLLLHYKWMLLL